MERDRFLQSDPWWYFSSYWVYKFQSPNTTEGGKHDYPITWSSTTFNLADVNSLRRKWLFNMLFLNVNITFHVIKHFIYSLFLNLGFYLLRLPFLTHLGNKPFHTLEQGKLESKRWHEPWPIIRLWKKSSVKWRMWREIIVTTSASQPHRYAFIFLKERELERYQWSDIIQLVFFFVVVVLTFTYRMISQLPVIETKDLW